MQRRHFLTNTAALAAAGLPLAPRSEAAPPDLKLGVASYSLRQFPLLKAVEAMKAMKVHYAKLKLEAHLPYNSSDAQIAEAKRMLDDAGITLVGSGNNSLQKPDESEIRSKFEFNRKLGVQVMTIAPTLQTLPLIEKCVKEFDIKVAIHNHGPEDRHFPAPCDVLRAVKSMDPRVGLCIDAGHTTRTGADLVVATRESSTRLHDFDIKDLADPMKKESQVDVGDGALPIAATFRELKRMNYAGVIMLEYEINADDPFLGMQRSLAYMRGVLAGLRI